jgi:hypothetical protein
MPSPLLFSRQFPLLAQSYLEEHQEHYCAQTEGDQRNGEHLAGDPTDHAGADQAGDNERRGRSKCQDARAGRHRPKVSLRLPLLGIDLTRDAFGITRMPIDGQILVPFLLAVLVIQVTPGPGMLFILANGIASGPRAGVADATASRARSSLGSDCD